jgi:hypothetical protein
MGTLGVMAASAHALIGMALKYPRSARARRRRLPIACFAAPPIRFDQLLAPINLVRSEVAVATVDYLGLAAVDGHDRLISVRPFIGSAHHRRLLRDPSSLP